MRKTIDAIDSVTGWTGSVAGVVADSVNTNPDYIAGHNSGSVVFHFPAGSLNQYISKNIVFDMTSYKDVVFSIWSRNKKSAGIDMQHASAFAYSLNFGNAPEYYIPLDDEFRDITIRVDPADASMTKIKITCLHNDDDYLIVSWFNAVKDQFPADVMQGLKDEIAYQVGLSYPDISGGVINKGILIGALTASAGDKSIFFESSLDWAQKYSVILIDDGIHSEIHQIDNTDEVAYYFNSEFDGKTLKYNYSGANVYLTVPVDFGMAEKEVILPGIVIWGMAPEEIYRSSKLDDVFDTFRADINSVQARRTYQTFKYSTLIDCEARQNELVAFASKIIRGVVGRESFWINGRKNNLTQESPSVYIEPVEGYNEIPKIQHSVSVEVQEELYERESQTTITNQNVTINPESL